MTELRLANSHARRARKLWRSNFSGLQQRVVVRRNTQQQLARFFERQMSLDTIPVRRNPRDVRTMMTELHSLSRFEWIHVSNLISRLPVGGISDLLSQHFKIKRIECDRT